MSPTRQVSSNATPLDLDGLLPDLEALYKDVHSHPELSMQETRTAALAADRLHAAGYEVTTGVGGTTSVPDAHFPECGSSSPATSYTGRCEA